MNIVKLHRGATLVAAAFAVAGLAGCGEHHRDADPLAKADPSAVVIGVTPAAPTGDPPGTTPVSDSASEVSKPVEQNSMPLPGQANDHSNLASAPSQRSGNSDKSTEKGQQQ